MGAGKASAFLHANQAARLFISWTIAAEFAEGFTDLLDPACGAMLSRFDMVPMDQEMARRYAITTKHLRGLNQLIGTNNLWIAAAALANGVPLVTNNGSHFNRVPGLSVIAY